MLNQTLPVHLFMGDDADTAPCGSAEHSTCGTQGLQGSSFMAHEHLVYEQRCALPEDLSPLSFQNKPMSAVETPGSI